MRNIAIVLVSLLLTSSTFAKITDYNAYIIRSQALEQKLEELSLREKTSDEYSFCGLFLTALQRELRYFRNDLSGISDISGAQSVVFHNSVASDEQEIIGEAQTDLCDASKVTAYLQRSQCKHSDEVQEILDEVETIRQDFLTNA